MAKKVLTYGTFDLLHIGHVRLFERLAALGDELIVCVSTDEFNAIKGKKSALPYEQRAEMVKSCRFVTKVLPENSWDQKREDILREGISVFGMGDDWKGKFDDLSDLCEVVYLPRTEDISSTQIKQVVGDAVGASVSEKFELTREPSEAAAPGQLDTDDLFERILAVAKSGNTDKSDYSKFLKELEVGEDAKGAGWLRCWILLNCLFRKKPNPTHAAIGKYERISRRKRREPEFNAFMSLLFQDLKLLRPIGGSYSQTFSGQDTAKILADCSKLVSEFETRGLTIFANSGTLLGLVRDGKFIEHDNDIDLGVVLSARSEEEAAAEWIAFCNKMIAEDMAVSRSEWSGVTLKLKPINGFGVDLFPAWIGADDRVYIFPHSYGNLPASDLLPLEKDKKSALPFPRNPRAILASNYGESWDVPQEGWRFNWVTARVQFAKFLAEIDALK